MDKDTLSTIRSMIADGVLSQSDAEKYFPELKDKEDNMEKELMKFFLMWGKDNSFRGYSVDEWYKWIHDRKKPQEWSKDDINMLNSIICDSTQGSVLSPDKIEWLKELTSRVDSKLHWKPTERQTKALTNLLKFIDSNKYSAPNPCDVISLVSLLSDLRKIE